MESQQPAQETCIVKPNRKRTAEEANFQPNGTQCGMPSCLVHLGLSHDFFLGDIDY